MSCGVGCRRSSDPELLWLWRRLVATAPIGPLAWEPPYAAGVAQEMGKRQKKKKKDPVYLNWKSTACSTGALFNNNSDLVLSPCNVSSSVLNNLCFMYFEMSMKQIVLIIRILYKMNLSHKEVNLPKATQLVKFRASKVSNLCSLTPELWDDTSLFAGICHLSRNFSWKLFFFFFVFLGPHPWHIEVSRQGVELEL